VTSDDRTRPLTSDDLAAFITQRGISAEILHLPVETPTVEDAARAVGTEPDRIVKSLLFLIDGSPALVIACGSSLVSRRRLAAHFRVSPKRVKLAAPEAALLASGYPVGALPPFGHRDQLPTLIDRRVVAQKEVYAGGGSIRALLRIGSQELARVTQATMLDLVEEEETEGP
jgi:prolyl-tRNA editing enzyme YbaK/EbsC (Cys-tRNA(Pro) deacylase)